MSLAQSERELLSSIDERRDTIVAHVTRLIEDRGEDRVLYD